MEPRRYFYSTDGTDALGPVTEEEFCQLIRDKVIGTESYFCLEGETRWRPLEPDVFVRPPGTTRLPPYQPPPYVPRPDAVARDEERIEQLQDAWDEPGPYPIALSWLCWLWAIGATIIVQKMRHGADGIIGDIGAFIVMGVAPYLLSRLFPSAWRLRACFIAMVLISVGTIEALMQLYPETAAAPDTADAQPAPDSSK